jgi:hypothetical protein
VAEFVTEARMEGLADADGIVGRMEELYDARALDAYADDPENPKAFAAFQNTLNVITGETMTLVRAAFVTSAHRKTPEVMAGLKRVIDAYDTLTGNDCILASSWEFNGAPPTTSFWESLGFEKQETVLVRRRPGSPESPGVPSASEEHQPPKLT